MFVTYRFRLLPRKAQHRALERILESQRQLYNAALEERIGAYRNARKSITYFEQCRGLTEWRRGDPDAVDVPVNLQRATLRKLDEAYRGFSRRVAAGRQPGFPRFRGKSRFDSFGFTQFADITLAHGSLRFKGMPGPLRVHWHRKLPVECPIKTCVLKRDTKGWHVSFSLVVKEAPPRLGKRVVGVDLGLTTFVALSDGGFIPSLRASLTAEGRLRRSQRALARKRRGSRARRKARHVLARWYAAVARRRREHLHQASSRLVRDYDVIAVEKLGVKGLARSVLAKHVQDASWAKFLSMLRYKVEWTGARLIEVDPRHSSQECSRCGVTVAKRLADRWHDCPACGLSLDRDLNAARNIQRRAGVGPSLLNVAIYGMRAGENLALTP